MWLEWNKELNETCVNALRAPRSLTGLGRQPGLGENGHMAKTGMGRKRGRT